MASDFSIRLKRPLRLKDGRILSRLGDAVVLIGELPGFPDLQTGWQLACDALSRAASTRDIADIELASCELELALGQDELLDAGARRAMPAILKPTASSDHLLVAGADDRSCHVIRSALGSGRGYRLSFAVGAAEAVSVLERDRPDLLLLDMLLPRASRTVVPSAARLAVPITFMVGSTRGARALARLSWPHLVKPLDADTLSKEMRRRCSDIERTMQISRQIMHDLQRKKQELRDAIREANETVRRIRSEWRSGPP